MRGLLICLLFTAVGVAAAADIPSWTYLGPNSTSQPAWIQLVAAPASSDETLPTLAFDVSPPLAGLEVLVTITFSESEGGFLRLLWTSQDGQPIALSENFQEGIGMANRRSILIPKELLQSPGRLTIMSDSADLKVAAVRWDWLQPQTFSVASGPAQRWRLIDATGHGRSYTAISGDPPGPSPDQVQNDIITAPILQKPERIEIPTEFSASLTTLPSLARLDGYLTGVPLGVPVRIWINGQDAGYLSIIVPDLADPGYQASATGSASYIGWRHATAWIDTTRLIVGENKIQFEPLWNDQGIRPIALKELCLQLNYGTIQASPSSPSNPTP